MSKTYDVNFPYPLSKLDHTIRVYCTPEFIDHTMRPEQVRMAIIECFKRGEENEVLRAAQCCYDQDGYLKAIMD